MQTPCPHCGEDIPLPVWRVMLRCPSCKKLSLNPLQTDLPPATEQVRRDRSRVSGVLLALGGLGLWGAFTLGSVWPAFLLVALLGMVGFSASQSGRPGSSHPLVKVIVGIFAAAGVVVILGVAVLAFLFLQCARGEIRWGG